ncbi:hypothetical protein GCM10020358_58320 [Amorphoplanes nipponensis]|uniref:Uncharacterized protein n=1 Tax=Actinoplanes nipponensis TaxID=135950 RepID=A0A919MK62_9ACTN|nr:hypothetical protein [Actinoplanes nipponensis]GIE52534.1 hypothetical protein Ani05nite_60680 [Actinoplanes nipponensis]
MASAQVARHPGAYRDQRDDPELAIEVTQDFIADHWQRAIPALVAQASDDASLERLLHTSMKNWLIDKFLTTTVHGSVTKTLTEHLAAHDEFEQVPAGQDGAGRWRLAGTQEPPWGGGLDCLVAAAGMVRAKVIRWESETRRAPLTTAEDLSAVVRAVMQAAGGCLSVQQLVEVLLRRFAGTVTTLAMPPDALDLEAEQVADSGPLPPDIWQAHEEASAAAHAAADVIGQLTVQERHLLGLQAAAENPAAAVRRVQEYLGCGRSKAYLQMERVRALVRELAGAVEDSELVVRGVLAACRAALPGAEGVDNPGDGSSDHDEDFIDGDRREAS